MVVARASGPHGTGGAKAGWPVMKPYTIPEWTTTRNDKYHTHQNCFTNNLKVLRFSRTA